jgi:TPR repeat protein
MPLAHANRKTRALTLVASLWLAIPPPAPAQATATIPDGVHYKIASDTANASARDLLAKSFASGHVVSDSFFDSAVTCGPTLWRAIQPAADKTLLDSKLIVVLVNSIQAEARGMITNEQRQSFWATLLDKYPTLRTSNIRKAHADEIRYFWATVPFDIEEPFLAIDAGPEKFIVNFRMVNGIPKLAWIDIVGNLQKLTSVFGSVVDLTVLTTMAEGGNTTSMVQLAEAYWAGKSIPLDLDKSRYWFDRAAQKGSQTAQMFLGTSYMSGQKFPKDSTIAARYLQMAAGQGSALAQYFVGMLYRHGSGLEKSDEKAAEYLQMAVKQNHSPAEYDLGVMYGNGEGVPQNKGLACDLYEKAADQGHIRAMISLGQCYDLGEGKEKNLVKASEMYTKAATLGDSGAQGKLARLYGEQGDWEESYFWLRVAENAGATQNRPVIDLIKPRLTQSQIDEAETKILQWLKTHPPKSQGSPPEVSP